MFDFSTITITKRTCVQCGAEFTAVKKEASLCQQCQYYLDNPEQAPKYFTWTKSGSGDGWVITARWPNNEAPPEPGLEVAVHRKDGSSSFQTILETVREGYDYVGERKVWCAIVEQAVSQP